MESVRRLRFDSAREWSKRGAVAIAPHRAAASARLCVHGRGGDEGVDCADVYVSLLPAAAFGACERRGGDRLWLLHLSDLLVALSARDRSRICSCGGVRRRSPGGTGHGAPGGLRSLAVVGDSVRGASGDGVAHIFP